MTEHEKNNLNELKNIDESSIEELSHDFPILGKSAKDRILRKCLEKTEDNNFRENEITVSGTEIYKRPVWRRVLGTAAAFAAAFVMISGAVYLKRNLTPTIVTPSSGESMNSSMADNSESETITNEFNYTETAALTTAVSTFISDYAVQTETAPFTVTSASSQTSAETTSSVSSTTVTDDEEKTTTTAETAAEEIPYTAFIGKWNAVGTEEDRVFVFNSDGKSGTFTRTESGLSVSFEYEVKDGIASFRFGNSDSQPVTATFEFTEDDGIIFHWNYNQDETLTRITEE